MKKYRTNYIALVFIVFFASACHKSSFLDAKPDAALVVPQNLQDFQALLDNDQVMNGAGNQGVLPALGEVASDDYFLLDDDFNGAIAPLYRNCYTWAKHLYNSEEILDWDYPYRAIFYANTVLDGLAKLQVSATEQPALNNIKGAACFNRAMMNFSLAQVFAAPYDSVLAGSLPGIPLRLHGDINEIIQRSTLKQSYQQITADLLLAVSLLPNQPLFKSRPSKAAAFALLSRVYLSMRDYSRASLYADSSLDIQHALMDFNKLVPGSGYAIQRFNEEVLFNCTLLSPDPLNYGYADTTLYNSYDADDLRKIIFFQSYNGLAYFTGSYDGSYNLFGGMATDELLLTKAECQARAGDTAAALANLNRLLVTRWKAGLYKPITATTAADALQKILLERRKELVFRGLRWMDLRRLNKEPSFAKPLERIINSQAFVLPPNDARYVYPIPDNVINLHPDMTQNPR